MTVTGAALALALAWWGLTWRYRRTPRHAAERTARRRPYLAAHRAGDYRLTFGWG
jgi:hypothetical protein